VLDFAAGILGDPAIGQSPKDVERKCRSESQDQAKRADAFLPNEMWIHIGDSIAWTFVPKNEAHTVTLLTPGEVRPMAPPPVGPPFPASGCPTVAPGFQSGSATYTGASCVSSAPLNNGATFTVSFPNPGNYKLVCLVHANMNGTVHVLDDDALLPYFDYDRQARDQAHDLIDDSDSPREELRDFRRSANEVLMTGEVAATGGGRQYLAILRFFPGTIRVHVNDTVEWTNLDPTEPHTVTFGVEPFVPTTLVGVSASPWTGVSDTTGGIDPDGAWHGVIPNSITSPVFVAPPSTLACFPSPGMACSNTINSGFLQAAPEDAVGRVQTPAGTTRIRITFTQKGHYKYKCAIHALDGMLGEVIVE
jgi:plastocyanin